MLTVLTRATLAIAVLALLGCAAAEPIDPIDGLAPPSSGPTPLIDLDCAGLIDEATVSSAFSPETVPVDLSWYSDGTLFTVAQLGAQQAGALRCEWSDGGGSTERYLLVTVLPNAADSWAALSSELAVYQPRANEFGAASYSSCYTSDGYSSCRIDSLVDDRWISAVLGGLSSEDAAAAVFADLTTSVADAAPAETAWFDPDSLSPACDELLPLAELRAALGVNVEAWDNPLPTTAAYYGGLLAAGGTVCQWRNGFDSASAMTVTAILLPGGAWAWEDNWAVEPHATVMREPVDGIGDDAYSGCSVGSNDTDCWVAVVNSSHWLSISVNDESSNDERAVAAELAFLATKYID